MLFRSSVDFKRHCIGSELEFVVIPRICCITGRRLMFENAYKQTAMWTGPGDNMFEYRWYDKDEFLIARIKGEVLQHMISVLAF